MVPAQPASTEELPTGFSELRNRITDILARGKERARLAVEHERVRTYWEAGGVLNGFLAANEPAYGKQVMKKLAVAVGLSERLLYDMADMRQKLKILPARAKLTWTHYKRVLPLKEAEAREFYLQAASDREWTVRELEANIKADAYNKSASAKQNADNPGVLQAAEPMVFRAVRGKLYISRIAERGGQAVLDVGFGKQFELDDGTPEGLKMGDLVRSVKDPNAPEGYRLEPAASRRRTYVSRGSVYRIIDGDTLWASVGLGFKIRSDEKLRLRAIDTPEVNTAEGKRAQAYLEKTLSEAGEFVVTTQKIDLYDRYLADVFYLPGEPDMQRVAREGRYLNRELVEKGYARPWTSEKPPDYQKTG